MVAWADDDNVRFAKFRAFQVQRSTYEYSCPQRQAHLSPAGHACLRTLVDHLRDGEMSAVLVLQPTATAWTMCVGHADYVEVNSYFVVSASAYASVLKGAESDGVVVEGNIMDIVSAPPAHSAKPAEA